MTKLEQIYLDTGKAINKSGIILISKNDAQDFIKDCEINSYQILGIDGFFLYEDGRIQPSLEHSIDYTTAMPLPNIYIAATEFIRMQSENMVFEMVIR